MAKQTALDTRLARIEGVFDAISTAWSGAAPAAVAAAPALATAALPGAATVDTDTPFIRKLTAFAATLSDAEARDLQTLLLAAAATGRQAALVPLTDRQKAGSAFLKALDDSLLTGATESLDDGTEEIGPTITVVTVTTVVTITASHPIIGCHATMEEA